jgi:hypothetical protein
MAAKKPTKGSKAQNKKPAPAAPEQANALAAPSPVTSVPISKPEQAAINEMIQLAKLEYMKSLKGKIINEKRREIDTLDSQIKEFVGPYMLIGYDLNNQPVEIVSAEDQAGHDALLERFRRVMLKINQNIINSNGQDPYGFKNNSNED